MRFPVGLNPPVQLCRIAPEVKHPMTGFAYHSTIGFPTQGTPAESDDVIGQPSHLLKDLGFDIPKDRLTVLCEYLGNGFAGALDDQIIDINERLAQTLGQFLADC